MSRQKIRIAVAINSSGQWNCAGWSNAKNNDICDMALEGLQNEDRMEKIYFVEAEIEVPSSEPTVVKGTVV